MALYDPSRRNWTGITPIDAPDNTVFIDKNFTQDAPWTAPFSAKGLVFQDCNIVNCLLPADAVVSVANTVRKNMPTLLDGRKYGPQRRWVIVVRRIEAEPNVFENYDIEETRRVIGTPEAWTDNEVLKTKDLGPTVS